MFTPFLTRTFIAIALFLGALTGQKASLSVVHGIPGLPAAVEVFANGNSLFSFRFGDVRGPLSLDPGTYNIEVKLQGNTVLTGQPTLVAGSSYSAVAHLNETRDLRLSFFENDLAGIPAGESRIIARHLAAAPAVDVSALRIGGGGTPTRLFRNVTNGLSGAVDVVPASYFTFVTPANNPVPVAFLSNLDTSPAGSTNIVYAIGDLGRGSLRLVSQQLSSPAQAQLTVIHGIPDLPAPVEVFVNGQKAFSFDFEDKVGPLCLDAGTYNVEVKLNGNTVLSGNPTLEPGKSYNAVAHLLEPTGINLAVFENDTTDPGAGNTRVIARHLARAPAVDVVATINGRNVRLFQNVTNGQEGNGVAQSATYDLSLFAAGTNTRVFGPVEVTLRSDAVYFFHAIGDINGQFNFAVNSIDRATMLPLINAAPVGQSCGGRIWSSRSNARPEETFTINLFGAPSNVPALLAVGRPAPGIDLSAIGAPTCFLYVQPSAIVPVQTSAFGGGAVRVNLGADHVKDLSGVRAQWAVTSRTNSLGLRFTSALEFSKL